MRPRELEQASRLRDYLRQIPPKHPAYDLLEAALAKDNIVAACQIWKVYKAQQANRSTGNNSNGERK